MSDPIILGAREVGGGFLTGDVNIDVDRLLRSRALVAGSSGSGKSRLLRRLAEQLFGKVPPSASPGERGAGPDWACGTCGWTNFDIRNVCRNCGKDRS